MSCTMDVLYKEWKHFRRVLLLLVAVFGPLGYDYGLIVQAIMVAMV